MGLVWDNLCHEGEVRLDLRRAAPIANVASILGCARPKSE